MMVMQGQPEEFWPPISTWAGWSQRPRTRTHSLTVALSHTLTHSLALSLSRVRYWCFFGSAGSRLLASSFKIRRRSLLLCTMTLTHAMPDPNDLERGQPDKRDLLLKQTAKSKILLFRSLQNWALRCVARAAVIQSSRTDPDVQTGCSYPRSCELALTYVLRSYSCWSVVAFVFFVKKLG
jgi:hypothetical protein